DEQPAIRLQLSSHVAPLRPLKLPGPSPETLRCGMMDEQPTVISRPTGQDTDLASRGSLRSQRTALDRAEPADDCSLFIRTRTPLTTAAPRLDGGLERTTTLGVVAKHVEARTGRRQQQHVARARL